MKLLAQQGAKTVVTGRVTNAETGEHLDNVNIFLSYTTIGTSTAKDGTFILSNISVGMFDLVVSRVGYERQIINLQVVETDSLHYDIKLKPKLLQTKEIEVVAESPDEWKKNLEKFVRAFIGSTDNADQCRILNPEVLNFHFNEDTDILVASSDSILRVENTAIGYHLWILLVSFEWNVDKDFGRYLIYPLFVELKPSNSKEFYVWLETRTKTYKGSLKHFLKTLYLGNTDEEMFTIFTGPLNKLSRGRGHHVSPQEFKLEQVVGTPLKILNFSGYLRVEYGRRIEEDYVRRDRYRYERERIIGVSDLSFVSIISLNNSYVIIDSLGNLFNPLSIEISGKWSQNRVAELLPLY